MTEGIRPHKQGCTPWAAIPPDPSCPGCQAAEEWAAEVRAEDAAWQGWLQLIAFYPRGVCEGWGRG